MRPTLAPDPPRDAGSALGNATERYTDDGGTTIEAYGLADPRCLVAGTYNVTLDLLDAQVVTAGKVDRATCIAHADKIPAKQTLTLGYTDQRLEVDWNGPRQVTVQDSCVFDAGGIVIQIRSSGHGRGVGTYALGDGCSIQGVRVTLEGR